MRVNIVFVLMIAATIMTSCKDRNDMFIVSGYTTGEGDDVMLCSIDGNGSATRISGVRVGDNPSFFAFGKDGLVYFVNETDTFNLKAGGGITTLRYDSNEKSLTKVGAINQGGAGPCHITVSDDGKYLITANYGSGSISVARLDKEGIPGEITDVIFYGKRSHPHMTIYNPRLNIYYISDLGLDRVHQLKLDTAIGRLIDADVSYFRCEEGSGPRHMVIDKTSTSLYIANELNSTVAVFNILSDTAKVKQTVSTLPGDNSDNNFCADIHFSANHKMISCSNRGDNSIVTFRVGSDGKLSDPVFRGCGGNWPRNFTASPSGKFFLVANQKSDELSVIRTGQNTSVDTVSVLPFNTPSCVKFLQ